MKSKTVLNLCKNVRHLPIYSKKETIDESGHGQAANLILILGQFTKGKKRCICMATYSKCNRRLIQSNNSLCTQCIKSFNTLPYPISLVQYRAFLINVGHCVIEYH